MPETNWVDKRASLDDWLTPPEVLERVRAFFGGRIPFDPCTERDNPTGADTYCTGTTDDDGLSEPWGLDAFVNPPYSKNAAGVPQIRLWAAKIHEEARGGARIIALLPCGARFSTGYWQDHILSPLLDAVCFVRGRIKFLKASTREPGKGNNYDSAIYGFNVGLEAFRLAFGSLGACFAMKALREDR